MADLVSNAFNANQHVQHCCLDAVAHPGGNRAIKEVSGSTGRAFVPTSFKLAYVRMARFIAARAEEFNLCFSDVHGGFRV